MSAATVALPVRSSVRLVLLVALTVSLTLRGRRTDLASFWILLPLRRSLPGPGRVTVKVAVPRRLSSFALDSANAFDGFADGGAEDGGGAEEGGGTADDGGARTVSEAVPLLAA